MIMSHTRTGVRLIDQRIASRRLDIMYRFTLAALSSSSSSSHRSARLCAGAIYRFAVGDNWGGRPTKANQRVRSIHLVRQIGARSRAEIVSGTNDAQSGRRALAKIDGIYYFMSHISSAGPATIYVQFMCIQIEIMHMLGELCVCVYFATIVLLQHCVLHGRRPMANFRIRHIAPTSSPSPPSSPNKCRAYCARMLLFDGSLWRCLCERPHTPSSVHGKTVRHMSPNTLRPPPSPPHAHERTAVIRLR